MDNSINIVSCGGISPFVSRKCIFPVITVGLSLSRWKPELNNLQLSEAAEEFWKAVKELGKHRAPLWTM